MSATTDSCRKVSGAGIASHFIFGDYGAHVIEVTVVCEGDLTIDGVVAAAECGIVVNLLGVECDCGEGADLVVQNNSAEISEGAKLALRVLREFLLRRQRVTRRGEVSIDERSHRRGADRQRRCEVAGFSGVCVQVVQL
jgi:hypothetical protein